jgi:hypothetical protein
MSRMMFLAAVVVCGSHVSASSPVLPAYVEHGVGFIARALPGFTVTRRVCTVDRRGTTTESASAPHGQSEQTPTLLFTEVVSLR